jgi:glycosyltransferase involved in cell wall biosynthesis
LAVTDPRLVTFDKFMSEYARARFPGHPLEFAAIPVQPDVFVGGDPARVRAALSIGDRPVILSLGHVIPLRDRLLLVRALPRILEAVPDAVVVIVGRVYDRRCLDLAEALGVSGSVLAVGEVPHDEVKHYVASATLECHETQGYGIGTASIEVMASGVPIVAVVDGDNFPGFGLVDGRDLVMAQPDVESLADRVVEVLQDPAQRARVAAGGRKLVVDHFRIERVAEQYLSVYEQLVGESPGGRAA